MTDDEAGHISPSKVAQKHISAPTDGNNSVSRKVQKFGKAPCDLSAEASSTLRHIQVTEYTYLPIFVQAADFNTISDSTKGSSTSLFSDNSMLVQ